MNEVWVGFIGVIIGALTTPVISYLFESIKYTRAKKEIACIVSAEMHTISLHYDANLIKLNSILKSNTFGETVDYEKLRYKNEGYTAIDIKNIYMLTGDLAQDILRMYLYLRNNDLEISNAINIIFKTQTLSNDTKSNTIRKLITRFEHTSIRCTQLRDQLTIYQRSPSKYKYTLQAWPSKLFKIE